ncbi:MAG: hypothetical protein WBB42_06460 [Polyangiales bacterium]
MKLSAEPLSPDQTPLLRELVERKLHRAAQASVAFVYLSESSSASRTANLGQIFRLNPSPGSEDG